MLTVDPPDRLAGRVHAPGSDAYATATTPFNAAARQRPAVVVTATSADDVSDAVRLAAESGLRLVPQATGHGAAADLGDDVLLLDTTGLASVSVDAASRTATVGAGALWSSVQQTAERDGLLGLSGSTGTVAVAGYLLGGGVGWLSRPHGLASARLHAVSWVDGHGEQHRSTEESEDPLDREVLWACRGGGGAGVVTSLEIGLVPVERLWGGTLFWAAEHAAEVAAWWGPAVGLLGPTVCTSLSVLSVPPVPVVPAEIRGRQVVRLLVVGDGDASADDVRTRLGGLPEPLLGGLGPLDAAALSALHMDPPGPAAGIGEGRWLTEEALGSAGDVLGALPLDESFPLIGVELRHVEAAPSGVDGAMTDALGPVLLHAIGLAEDRERTEAGLAQVVSASEHVWTGRRVAAFSDDATAVSSAFDASVLDRLRRVRDAVDPDGVLARPRSQA